MSGPGVSYVICTRNRPAELARTLEAIEALPPHDAEVVIADNASDPPVEVCRSVAQKVPVTVAALDENRGAAGRNVAAKVATGEWLVMLDDDSHPVDLGFLAALAGAGGDVLAVSADIRLTRAGKREAGGLPEVFIGCGVAIRRGAFCEAGGYDCAMGYYVEEYDLSARLLAMGGRVAFEPRFKVEHRKVSGGRDMDEILRRLVRNNGWMLQRWAPEGERRGQLRAMRRRYRRIAEKEGALAGYARGVAELRRTIAGQARTPLLDVLWDRFTGLAQAREALGAAWRRRPFETAALAARGKHDWVVERALQELGVRVVEGEAERVVVGTMSPGPMLDAAERLGPGVLAPWVEAERGAVDVAA